MMMVAAFTSCDKDASNVKMEKVKGTYTGDIMSVLYIPDHATEMYMYLYEGDTLGCIASDVYKNGEVDFNFASDDKATFSVNRLDTINFRIQFLDVEDTIFIPKSVTEEDTILVYKVRDIYQFGALASMFEMVDSLLGNKSITYNEYKEFADMMTAFEDTIEFSKIECAPLQMKESGAIYTTYNFEQNSFIVPVQLNDFTFKRRTNATNFIKYAEDNFMSLLAPVHKQLLQKIKDGVKLSGTIKGAEGTCAVTYSNYRAMLMLVVTKADGIIDVLKDALIGPYKMSAFGYFEGEYDNDKVVPAPSQLWFEVNYEGSLSNISNWQQTGQD